MRIAVPLLAVIAAALPAPSIAVDESPNLRPGLWELTTRMSIGSAEVPSEMATRCLVAEDIRDMAKPPVQGADCSVDSHVVSRDRAETVVYCDVDGEGGRTDNGVTRGTVVSLFGGDRMEMRAVQEASGGGMRMTVEITGRRIGDC